MKEEKSLAEIRRLLQETRCLLTEHEFDQEERNLLEKGLVALHEAERTLLLRVEPRLSEECLQVKEYLEEISKQLRSISRALNQRSRALEQTRKVVRAASMLLQEVVDWVR